MLLELIQGLLPHWHGPIFIILSLSIGDLSIYFDIIWELPIIIENGRLCRPRSGRKGEISRGRGGELRGEEVSILPTLTLGRSPILLLPRHPHPHSAHLAILTPSHCKMCQTSNISISQPPLVPESSKKIVTSIQTLTCMSLRLQPGQ